jgi:hypothetical protein
MGGKEDVMAHAGTSLGLQAYLRLKEYAKVNNLTMTNALLGVLDIWVPHINANPKLCTAIPVTEGHSVGCKLPGDLSTTMDVLKKKHGLSRSRILRFSIYNALGLAPKVKKRSIRGVSGKKSVTISITPELNSRIIKLVKYDCAPADKLPNAIMVQFLEDSINWSGPLKYVNDDFKYRGKYSGVDINTISYSFKISAKCLKQVADDSFDFDQPKTNIIRQILDSYVEYKEKLNSIIPDYSNKTGQSVTIRLDKDTHVAFMEAKPEGVTISEHGRDMIRKGLNKHSEHGTFNGGAFDDDYTLSKEELDPDIIGPDAVLMIQDAAINADGGGI